MNERRKKTVDNTNARTQVTMIFINNKVKFHASRKKKHFVVSALQPVGQRLCLWVI